MMMADSNDLYIWGLEERVKALEVILRKVIDADVGGEAGPRYYEAVYEAEQLLKDKDIGTVKREHP